MDFEKKPQLNTLEIEKKRPMAPEEAEKELGEMRGYAEELRRVILEKQEALKKLQENHPQLGEEWKDEAEMEIGELGDQAEGLEEFEEEGAEILAGGGQFFKREI